MSRMRTKPEPTFFAETEPAGRVVKSYLTDNNQDIIGFFKKTLSSFDKDFVP
jgi:hypothetical protein